jgi:hypothetical protein
MVRIVPELARDPEVLALGNAWDDLFQCGSNLSNANISFAYRKNGDQAHLVLVVVNVRTVYVPVASLDCPFNLHRQTY